MAERKDIPEQPFKPGHVISAGALNRIAQGVPKMVTGTGSAKVKNYGSRVILGGDKPKPVVPDTSNYLMQFVVLHEYDDYLVCTPFICPNDAVKNLPQSYTPSLGQLSTNIFYVVKPYFLQRTPWNGKTISMYGTNYAITYTGIGQRTLNGVAQQIQPQYVQGDIILASKAVTGYYTGAADKYGSPEPVIFMDVNEAGRGWQSQQLTCTGADQSVVGGGSFAYSGGVTAPSVAFSPNGSVGPILNSWASLFEYFDNPPAPYFPPSPVVLPAVAGRITLPVSGIYILGFNAALTLSMLNTFTQPDVYGRLVVNASGAVRYPPGTILCPARVGHLDSPTGEWVLSSSTPVNMNAGDTIDFLLTIGNVSPSSGFGAPFSINCHLWVVSSH